MTEPLPMFHAGKTRRCVKCEGTRWRRSHKGTLICADCEKAKSLRRKAKRRAEA